MERHGFELSQRGGGRLNVLLTVLFFAAIAFVGSHVFPFFYYYHELQGLMESQVAKAQVFSDDQIRTNVMKKIKELQIPFDDPDQLKINRFDDKIVVELEYDEVFYIDLGNGKSYDIHTFHFHPRAEHRL
jgi:hypothetical protein